MCEEICKLGGSSLTRRIWDPQHIASHRRGFPLKTYSRILGISLNSRSLLLSLLFWASTAKISWCRIKQQDRRQALSSQNLSAGVRRRTSVNLPKGFDVHLWWTFVGGRLKTKEIRLLLWLSMVTFWIIPHYTMYTFLLDIRSEVSKAFGSWTEAWIPRYFIRRAECYHPVEWKGKVDQASISCPSDRIRQDAVSSLT